MSSPTPTVMPHGNGICVDTETSRFDYYILHNQNIPATTCSESVMGSPFEQTVTDYLKGSTELEYEFDDLEVIPTVQQQAINQITQMLGGAAPATPPKTQEMDFNVPTSTTWPIDFRKKKFEKNLSLGLSDDSGIDGLLNPYCWANGKLQNNLVQYKDQLGRMYGPENISSYASSMTSELRDQSNDFLEQQESDWTEELSNEINPFFSAEDSFEYNSERDGSGGSFEYNFNVGDNWNFQVGYGEFQVGSFALGPDQKVTKIVGISNTSQVTIGGGGGNSNGGTIVVTTPGGFLPTQGNSQRYNIRANYKLNDDWVASAFFEQSNFDFNIDPEVYTSNCGFLPKQSHTAGGFMLTFLLGKK
jgi:hypothetical protein